MTDYQLNFTPGQQLRQLRLWMIYETAAHNPDMARKIRRVIARMMRRREYFENV